MHPETLHQLMHRLSAEGRALSWGVESLLRQRLRDASRTIACLGQGPEPLTEERVITQVLGTANGAGDDARRGLTPDPFDSDASNSAVLYPLEKRAATGGSTLNPPNGPCHPTQPQSNLSRGATACRMNLTKNVWMTVLWLT